MKMDSDENRIVIPELPKKNKFRIDFKYFFIGASIASLIFGIMFNETKYNYLFWFNLAVSAIIHEIQKLKS